MLTEEAMIEKTQQAFLPLRCIAEVWDYQHKFRFKVFDGNKGIIEMPSLLFEDMQNEKRLDTVLKNVREQLEKKGFKLAA